MAHLPEEVVETIIAKLTSNRDRNSASLVSKSWYSVDRDSRRAVYVGNCYALSPERAIRRFPMLRSLTLKGKPSISDSRLLPNNWGGSVDPWIEVLSNNCPSLEKLRLKRMVVSDRSLQLIPISFPCFKSLILNSCSGFTISGLTAIASNCSMLEEFELEKSDVTDNSGGEWLSNFPESLCSLTSLNISSIRGLMNPTDLEQLVTRSPNLTKLTLNITTTSDTIRRILLKAPQLTHLGAGSNNPQLQINLYTVLASSFHKCKSIKSLALFHLIPPILLRSIYPICPNLVHLNLRCVVAGIQSLDLIRFIKNCPNLQRLSILDTIGDAGLQVVSHTCKNLQELKIYHGRTVVGVTDIGLTAISTGCQNLRALRYLCTRMTNTALITFSKNCSSTTCFKLTMLIPKQPDHTTQQPLDDGFRAIVQSCKDLRKLTLAGLLTDQVFLYIGMYAEKLEELSVLRAGESDAGMQYVFNGCKNLRKVEIIDCPFGNGVLSSGLFEESGCMRWLWMSSCRTTLGGCKMIAQRKESLNVEIITKNGDMEGDYPDDGMKVDKVYMYQALDGPRADASQHVWTL